jgi:serine/threonine protein kinase
LVVIRELVLAQLNPALQTYLLDAAHAEFAAPGLFGTSHLPGTGDRLVLEHGRIYAILQPRLVRGQQPLVLTPLDELLARPDAFRLSTTVALQWGTRLCQTVARLHQTQTLLGEISPALVLVPGAFQDDAAPLLLPAWPPAPAYWSVDTLQEARLLVRQFFPPIETWISASQTRSFAAPEAFTNSCDERSDVYALGALLYFLLTRQPPTPAPLRQQAQQQIESKTERRLVNQSNGHKSGSTLLPPRQHNPEISSLLEQILLRALALQPEERFASVIDLASALEGLHMKEEIPAPGMPPATFSRLRRILKWLKVS